MARNSPACHGMSWHVMATGLISFKRFVGEVDPPRKTRLTLPLGVVFWVTLITMFVLNWGWPLSIGAVEFTTLFKLRLSYHVITLLKNLLSVYRNEWGSWKMPYLSISIQIYPDLSRSIHIISNALENIDINGQFLVTFWRPSRPSCLAQGSQGSREGALRNRIEVSKWSDEERSELELSRTKQIYIYIYIYIYVYNWWSYLEYSGIIWNDPELPVVPHKAVAEVSE